MPWLDWLRFGAALAVLLAHVRVRVFVEYGALDAGSQGLFSQLLFAATRLGHEAVLVFFVLSGFLVGGRASDRARRCEFRWRDYAIDRATRITVPLVPAVALTAAVMTIAGTPPSVVEVLGNLAQLQGLAVPPLEANGPLWSLPYEVWFYIGCGALLVTLGGGGRRAGMAAAIFGLSALVLVLLEPVYLICWCMGAVAYHLKRSRPAAHEIAVALCLTAVGVLASQFTDDSRTFDFAVGGEVAQRGAALLISLGVALLIRNLAAAAVAIRGLDGVGAKLADLSYTLYLFHYPILFLVAHLGLTPSATIDAAASATFVLLTLGAGAFSYVAYLMFERNTAVLRRVVKARLAQKRARATVGA
jgi:peptidoglycan/LPS O-acetylase OafA/YrhL